ncbi:MFS transporter [Nocardia cerradoensis]|uniref:MFS transporter n=1 Tax=Nocardia cerradoensis TaxID=85688 RepID=UPI00030215A6|nr:MFS transporter [Nocardia cerradoensis]
MAVLVLLCAVQFLDIVDSAIVNVALPSIQHSLHFTQQNLQWVASGYILTYGGFLLAGGRLGDLLGRRRMLFAGLVVFASSSLTAGLTDDAGLLIAARLVQGIGAAFMAPAALSELTTSFREGKDRDTALGVWGGISGVAAAAGVFLGGIIAQGPGWRWVFFVNPPICVAVIACAVMLLADDRPSRTGRAAFDSHGAVLLTGGMLLLVYGLVRAPIVGWGSLSTVLCLGGSAALLAAFALNEARTRDPLVPAPVLRVKGLVAADLTQLIAFAGFFSLLFYATLYMQEILHYSPCRRQPGRLRRDARVGRGGDCDEHRPRPQRHHEESRQEIFEVGTVHRHLGHVIDACPGEQAAHDHHRAGADARDQLRRNASGDGEPGGDRKVGESGPDRRNSSQQVGSAAGLAILSAVAITRTDNLIAAGASAAVAADSGYQRALLVGAILMGVAALIALRTGNTRMRAPLVMVDAEASYPAK